MLIVMRSRRPASRRSARSGEKIRFMPSCGDQKVLKLGKIACQPKAADDFLL
ncbi:MAG TPA: hypothetical protein VHU21_24230 [Paraburkholderia sp.]|nr:hypothetical protein [Paraburkholderia sp.]